MDTPKDEKISTDKDVYEGEPIMSDADKKDIEENKGIAAISYLWILAFLPLFWKKDSKFAQFHARQGVVLFIFEVIISIIWPIPIIGWIIGPIGYVLALILSVIGIVKALQGQYWEMPVLGKYVKKLNL